MIALKHFQTSFTATRHTTLQTRRFPSRKNSILRCSKSNDSDSESETPSPEGDAQKQEMLVRIAMIEAEKVRLGQFLDDKSEFLTKFGEDTNAEFDKIGEDALKGLDEATARAADDTPKKAWLTSRYLNHKKTV